MGSAPALAQTNEFGGLGRPLKIRLSQIERYENQPRRHFDQKSIELLADSIQKDGQKQPIKVCKHSTKKGVFVLIGGERRTRAFKVIGDRTSSDPLIDAWIDVVNNEHHHFREAMLDNLMREDLVPVDEAAGYHRLYAESLQHTHRAKLMEIAGMVKKSVTHVENYVHLHSISAEVKLLLNPGLPRDERLSVTAAIDIVRSTSDPVLQLAIAKEAIARNLGIVEVRTLVQQKTGNYHALVERRARKPSDDYKTFAIGLGQMLRKVKQLSSMDIDDMYDSRVNESAERTKDLDTIDRLAASLELLRRRVEPKKRQ